MERDGSCLIFIIIYVGLSRFTIYNFIYVATLKSMNIAVVTFSFVTICNICYIYTARMFRFIF